ncbi:hypothetical protein L228DRAFT_248965 [Xylona heveae TC161]|uniref:RBR-type E3 ubiquitin transferase n=1 Tax=Xylona heveae (strain CBS 132557 / TC161) TaxID=1328760 RepID=A0A165FNC4_XYLHT|nr:hypothetical protein L228DRAFT_248965 [Xylona heveae TC161]KZF21187.1 hypothetical protein L228DRAFT_248965 [Xylona heveae TC161]
MSQSRLQSDSSKRASDKPARLSAKRMSNPQIGNATAKSSPAPSRSATPKVVRSTSMQEKPTSASPRPGVQRSNTTATSQGQPPTSSAPTAAEPSMGKTGTATGPKQRRGSVGLFAALFGPSPQRPEKKVACLTCAADDVPMSKSAKLACGHRMCHECLKRVFTMSISDPQHMPPRCCTQDHIPLRHVDRLFNDKFKMQWNKKYQEYTTKNRIYCPTRGCGEWIRPGNIQIDSSSGRKYGKCSRCKTKICCLCNAKWHTRRECPNDEETKRFIEVAKQEGWQRCFNCKAMVELKEGCNHMTCRCGAEFCMICARRWKTCDCPWFNHGAIADGDRLNHFNVPQPQAGAPPGYGHYRRATADDIGGYRGGALAYHEELGQRRRQEQEDEILARRLQILGMEDDDEDGHEDAIVDAVLNDYATRRRARRQHQHLVQQQQLQRRREREMAREEQARREYGQQGDIFGIGNTTDHFMNEDYVHARNPANLFTGHFFDNAAAIANQMRGLDDRQALNGSWAPPGLLVEEQPRRDTRTSKRNRRNTNTQTREGEDASPAANPTHGRMSSDLTTANVLNRPGAGRRRHTLMGSDGKIGSWLHNIG